MNTYNTALIGFRKMNNTELSALADSFSLGIGAGELQFIRHHYEFKEKRDPEADELRLLARMILHSERQTRAFLLSKINSRNAELGETFDDMKRKLSSLGKRAPYSFDDRAKAADLYLKCAGKKTAAPQLYGKCGKNTELEFIAKGCRPIFKITAQSGSFCTVGKPVMPPYSHDVNNTDTFIMLFSDMSTESFHSALSELLFNPEISRSVKSATTLSEGYLVNYLLESSKGVYIMYEDPLSLLTEKRDDAIVLLVDGKAISDIFAAAAEKNIGFATLGNPINDGKLTVRGASSLFSIDAEFLRSLRFTAKLSAVEPQDPPALYFGDSHLFEYGEVLASENTVCSASATKTATFSDTADTVISAISPLIARGASSENISVSFDARLPLLGFNESHAYAALALLLGQYRVQAELSLLSEGSQYKATKNELSLVAYARASEAEKNMPDTVTRSEGKLFILAAHRRGTLPDFSELRALFKYINNLVTDGRALSVRAVGRDGIEAALKKMTGNAELSEYSLPEEIISSPVGAFIVESESEIGGVRVNYKIRQIPEK